MASPISSRRVVVVSFLVDILDVVTNLVVSVLTGSAVIFSEMAAGLADSMGSALLVIGERRARRPPDAHHPFGHGREAFFWGLLSAVTMMVVGGGLAAWRGIDQLVHPRPLEHTGLAVAVLALAILSNGYAVRLSFRKLTEEGAGLRAAFRDAKRPLVKGALLRDAVGTATSVFGLVAILLYRSFEMVALDAIGALVAAALTTGAALALMAQARELITGRALPAAQRRRLRRVVRQIPEVEAVNRLAAVYVGTKEVLVDVDLDLAEGLDTTRIESLLDDVEERVRAALPDVREVRISLNSPGGAAQARAARAERR